MPEPITLRNLGRYDLVKRFSKLIMRSQAVRLASSIAPKHVTRLCPIGLLASSSNSYLPIRAFNTSSPLSKKAKSSSSRRAQQQDKEEDPVIDPKWSDKAPEVDLDEVMERTKSKMSKSVDWARGVVYEGVERGRGRISPGQSNLLSSSFTLNRIGSVVGFGESDGTGYTGFEIVEFGGFRYDKRECAIRGCLGG